MIRRVERSPAKGQRYIQRSGAYAILPLKGRLLMTAQVDGALDIQLPGGGIDAGESPLQALYREVREEIGWSIARPRRLGAFREFVFMPEYDLWAEKVCHVYLAHPVRQICEPVEEHHVTLVLSWDDALVQLNNAGSRLFVERAYPTG
jgi:8-oxo-dGTP diphosphatase